MGYQWHPYGGTTAKNNGFSYMPTRMSFRRASPSVAPTAGTNDHSRNQRLWACTCTPIPILLKRRPGANRQNTRIKTVGFGCRHPRHETCGLRPAGSEL